MLSSRLNESNRWGLPLLFAGLAAGGAGAVWLTLNHLGVPIQQLGWPFGHIVWFTLLSAFPGFVFGQAYLAQQLRREAAKEDPVELDEEEPAVDELLPDLPTFANQVAVNRRSTRIVDGTTVDVFDLTTAVSDGDGGTTRLVRTIALMSADGLPPFELRPWSFHDRFLLWAGAAGLEFDPAAPGTLDGRDLVQRFVATYRLAGASTETMISGVVTVDDEAVRRVFPLRVMRVMLDRQDWHLQSHGGRLACWVETVALGPKRRDKLIEDAVKLRSRLLETLEGKAGEPVASPPDAASTQRQAARLQASLLGGVLGAFVGFFSAGLLQVGEVLDPGSSSVVFPAATVCGVLLGVVVGRSLPLKQPALRKPDDARREKVVGCAVVAGLFGGFLTGGIAGIVLGEWIDLKIDDHKPRALLVFGCIGAGTLLGPVVLGVMTNFVYQWVGGRRNANAPGTPSEDSRSGTR